MRLTNTLSYLRREYIMRDWDSSRNYRVCGQYLRLRCVRSMDELQQTMLITRTLTRCSIIARRKIKRSTSCCYSVRNHIITESCHTHVYVVNNVHYISGAIINTAGCMYPCAPTVRLCTEILHKKLAQVDTRTDQNIQNGK